MAKNSERRSAIVYARLSDARGGDSINDQRQRCLRRAEELGWDVARVVTENDLTDRGRSHASAFKRHKVTLPDGRKELRVFRPGWRSVLEDLSSGSADALLALDLDRVARDPRDLEDLIDVVESTFPRIPVESVTGSLRLATDADVTMARVLVAVSNKSSRDTSRRVAAARERKALRGAYGGGRRPFGYESDGMTVREDEAREVTRWADQVIAGLSLRSIVQDLRERGVSTVTGAQWATGTIRDILLRPRNAGFAVYRGQEVGPAHWPAILEEATWRAACSVLNDPARVTTPGNQPKRLGSLIYRCHCGETVSVSGGRAQNRSYVCRGPVSHLRRVAGPVDALVTELVIQRLSQPDSIGLLVPGSDIDVGKVASEINELRERQAELGRLFACGDIGGPALKSANGKLSADLRIAEATLATAAGPSPLAQIAGRSDAEAIWARMDVGARRAVIRLMLNITLLPAKGGRRPDGQYFDRSTVQVDWLVE